MNRRPGKKISTFGRQGLDQKEKIRKIDKIGGVDKDSNKMTRKSQVDKKWKSKKGQINE
jgi:hypothetical protein